MESTYISNCIYLSWEELFFMLEDITCRIQNKKIDVILAIQRGGLIPGVLLSHKLGIRDFIVLDVRITDSDLINSKKNAPVLIPVKNIEQIRGKHILIVDDIIGSGKTYECVIDYLREYAPASIDGYICVANETNWKKENGTEPLPESLCVGKIVNRWVVFPWEQATPARAFTSLVSTLANEAK